MMNTMSKMPEEKKLELMSQIMSSTDSTSCNDMMRRMSAVFSNDSLSNDEMASQMLPVCVGGIVTEVDTDQRAEYQLNLIKDIINSGFVSYRIRINGSIRKK
jgi:hypothetical protein